MPLLSWMPCPSQRGPLIHIPFMKKDTKTTVYFDGSCPLCTAEISVYRERGTELEFVDVSRTDIASPADLPQEKAMKRFHVRRKDGTLLDGGDAFVELWSLTPGFKLLARVFRLPGLKLFANLGYNGFLYIRPVVQKLFVWLQSSKQQIH